MNRVLISLILPLLLVLTAGCGEKVGETPEISPGMQKSAENLVGLEFTDAERDLGRADLAEQRDSFESLRKHPLDNAVLPAVRFDPLVPWGGTVPEAWKTGFLRDFPPSFEDFGPATRPADLNDLAFAGIAQLAALHPREAKSVASKLTELSLARLVEHGPTLRVRGHPAARGAALARARELDRMLDRGEYLGPLHGIPYGAKDLLAVAGRPHDLGRHALPGPDPRRDATVVHRLDDAGAVLVAKLTLGALAWGDVWFGGKTRNPWNLEQGSSGSSAGSASAVSAGLVPFAIGHRDPGDRSSRPAPAAA